MDTYVEWEAGWVRRARYTPLVAVQGDVDGDRALRRQAEHRSEFDVPQLLCAVLQGLCEENEVRSSAL